ncbi:plasmid stabilization system [Halogeometricum borinquense]|uniref:Plasmid stabilization system n=1 Tax=Halogeometricum borinquense TaxID=60847 RepID=A0A482SYG7_9EURY|nr:plasmid stabilization system [Halogeometricum borinquense]
MHISRTWTAFDETYENAREVGILEILPIDDVQDDYGF